MGLHCANQVLEGRQPGGTHIARQIIVVKLPSKNVKLAAGDKRWPLGGIVEVFATVHPQVMDCLPIKAGDGCQKLCGAIGRASSG